MYTKFWFCSTAGTANQNIFGVLGTGITVILAFLGQCHFYGLKELCPGVPQNSVWDTECPEFSEVIKIRHCWQCIQMF